eukprot:s1794_g13.t1
MKVPQVESHVATHHKYHRYFTDGACVHPTIADARLSGCAVIRDMAPNEQQALMLTQIAMDKQVMCPFLQVCMMGITPGRQTISRAELTAIAIAAESAQLDPSLELADIVTDSQYVINVIHFLEHHDLVSWGHRVANFDLVTRLAAAWKFDIFRIHKIKSHQDLSDAPDLKTQRWIMGNAVADKIASKAIQRGPLRLRQQAESISQHQKQQACDLERVFKYLVEMNNERKMLTLQSEQAKGSTSSSSTHRQFMGQEALEVLSNFSCHDTHALDFSDIDTDLLKAYLQGYNLARLILLWAQSLLWPPEDLNGQDENSQMVINWGISWFELYMNFLIVTGQHCPMRISGSLADTVFVPFDSDEARLQPSLQRSVMVQCTAFQAAVRLQTTLPTLQPLARL